MAFLMFVERVSLKGMGIIYLEMRFVAVGSWKGRGGLILLVFWAQALLCSLSRSLHPDSRIIWPIVL